MVEADVLRRPARWPRAACSPSRLKARRTAASHGNAGFDRSRRKEGKVSFIQRVGAQRRRALGKTFEAKYPGIAVRVERSGAERIFQRIAQRAGPANINSVDVANSTDPAALSRLEEEGLAGRPICRRNVANISRRIRSIRRHVRHSCAWLEAIGLQHQPGEREDAPKSYADLLDPKWVGKSSGPSRLQRRDPWTATFVLARDLGLPYLENWRSRGAAGANRRPTRRKRPARRARGDGRRHDYNLVLLKDDGKPGRRCTHRRLAA